jgi:hypothetical protein
VNTHPASIAAAVREAGCKLVAKEGRLFVTPPGKLPDRLRPALEAHKAELIAWLSAPQWTDEEAAAVCQFWASYPDAPDCHFVRAADGSLLGCASSAELAEWSASGRRRPGWKNEPTPDVETVEVPTPRSRKGAH